MVISTFFFLACGPTEVPASLDLVAAQSEPSVVETPAAPPEPEAREVVHTIARGESLGKIFARYDLRGVHDVVAASAEVFDLGRIRAGNDLVLTYDHLPERLTEIRYAIDEDATLLLTFDEAGTPTATLDEVLYDREIEHFSLPVDPSLWQAALDQGLRGTDVMRVAEIFDYEVDFGRLRPGDVFEIVGDGLSTDGEFV